jgi:Ser/Thr protein kinase RdoA (MazF antagonist)
MAHEGPLLAYLAGQPVPTLLGQAGCRSLLGEIPGRDLVAPKLPVLRDMVSLLVRLQQEYATRIGELLGLGVPDWRSPILIASIADVVDRTSAELSAEDNATLRDFVRTLPERCAEVDACGVPNSLIHGDFWPGNVRGEAEDLTLLDWGDSGVGNPLLDQSAFLERTPPNNVDAIRQHWVHQWQTAVPDSDPARASARLGPISAARRAVVYWRFLDQIEPSEHPYHRSDPADMLRRAAALLRSAG